MVLSCLIPWFATRIQVETAASQQGYNLNLGAANSSSQYGASSQQNYGQEMHSNGYAQERLLPEDYGYGGSDSYSCHSQPPQKFGGSHNSSSSRSGPALLGTSGRAAASSQAQGGGGFGGFDDGWDEPATGSNAKGSKAQGTRAASGNQEADDDDDWGKW